MVNTGRSAKSCIKMTFIFNTWATKTHSANINSFASWNSLWVSQSSKSRFWVLAKMELQTIIWYMWIKYLYGNQKRKMLTLGRHPKDPKMEQKVDYYTSAQCKLILNISKTFKSGICTCWISKLFCPKTSLTIIPSTAENSHQKTVQFFKQTEWNPSPFFFFPPSFNNNSLSQRLMQINFKIAICYKQQIAMNNELVRNPF